MSCSTNEMINSDRYSQQLIRLNQELERNHPFTGKGKCPVKLLHDNARPHVGKSVKETLLALGWEVLPHPAYSPDIAPSDYHLLRSMQNALSGVHFRAFEEVRKWMDNFIASKDEIFFWNSLAARKMAKDQ
ncbi:MOS1T transposase, partial [Pseudoatta argentina]